MLNKYWKIFVNWKKSFKYSNDIDMIDIENNNEQKKEMNDEIMVYKIKKETTVEIQVETTNEIQVETTNEIQVETTNEMVEEIKYYKGGGLEMMEEPSLNDK